MKTANEHVARTVAERTGLVYPHADIDVEQIESMDIWTVQVSGLPNFPYPVDVTIEQFDHVQVVALDAHVEGSESDPEGRIAWILQMIRSLAGDAA